MHGIMRYRGLIFFSASISILLSIWAALKAVVINPDAICYLQSAEGIPMGLHFVTHLCGQAKWPFYSALIYFFENFTKISMQNSAHFLNGCFSLISVVSFILITYCLNGTKRVLWLAAFVILLAHEFNSLRECIVRDHGFWAFYLLSILFLLLFFRENLWRYALAWSVSLLIATLFRIEGVIFLLFVPMATFFNSAKRISSFFKLHTLSLLLFFCLMVWLFLHPDKGVGELGRLGEVKNQFLVGFAEVAKQFSSKAEILNQQIFTPLSLKDSEIILGLIFIFWYLQSVISNISFIYAGLVVYAWIRKLLKDNQASLVLWSYIIVNVIVTGTFLVEHMFLAKRYLLALSLTLMVWIPLALDDFCKQYSRRKLPLLASIVLIIVFAVGGIFDFGYSKKYIRDAGEWLEFNLPQNATLYSNDNLVMYYSKRFGYDIFTKNIEFSQQNMLAADTMKQYDYLALRLNKNSSLDQPEFKNLGTPVQIFSNKRGDKVVIFKTNSERRML